MRLAGLRPRFLSEGVGLGAHHLGFGRSFGKLPWSFLRDDPNIGPLELGSKTEA